MTSVNLIEIFCILDEFCKYFEPELRRHTLGTPGKRHRNRPCRMSDSEVMAILVIFHTRRFRDLKSFYLYYVCRHMREEFPHTVSYNRFVERQAQVGMHLLLFLETCALGKCTMGWFYGFKLHLVINDKGEIMQWRLTPGNADDRSPIEIQ